SSRRSVRPHPPDPTLLPYAAMALITSLVFFAIRLQTDNYYLVDRDAHRIFYHFKFLWFRSKRLLLERGDILAVTTVGRKTGSRSGTWWEYRVVVVGAARRRVPVSNWRREGLGQCNAEAAKLARMLDCQYYKSQAWCET